MRYERLSELAADRTVMDGSHSRTDYVFWLRRIYEGR